MINEMKVYTKTEDKGTTALLAEPESQRSPN
jgi:cob(I)alamin adenosyltransferase